MTCLQADHTCLGQTLTCRIFSPDRSSRSGIEFTKYIWTVWGGLSFGPQTLRMLNNAPISFKANLTYSPSSTFKWHYGTKIEVYPFLKTKI